MTETALMKNYRKELAATDNRKVIPSTQEVGWWDSNIYSTKDWPKYNPDALLTNKGWGIYEKMMLDDQVKAVTQFKTNAVISRGHLFEKDPDNPQHEEMADFFVYVLAKLRGSFKDALVGMLSAKINGFSITEKVSMPLDYKGKAMWGIKSLKLRPFDTFRDGIEVDKHGNITAIRQWQGGDAVEIPYNCVIHFVHQPDVDEHYGESDLKSAYRAYWSKDIVIKFLNIHLERHASGFIWAQTKGPITSGQQADLRDLITNISAKMGAIIPENVDLNQFNPMRTDAFEKAIAIFDKAIAKSQLVPNLLGLSEQGSVGSNAQSKTQLEIFFWVLDAIAVRLEDTLNEQLFKQLSVWNYGTEDFPPFKFEPISDMQKRELAATWGDLIQKGAVTRTDIDEDYTRKLLDYPAKPEVEEEEGEGQLPGDAGTPAAPPTGDKPSAPTDADVGDAEDDDPEIAFKQHAERPWLRRVDFARIKNSMDMNDEAALIEQNAILANWRASIDQQVAKIAGERSFGNVGWKEIEAVEIPSKLLTSFRQATRKHLERSLSDGYTQAKKELPKKQMAKVIRPGMDLTQAEKYLASKTFKVTGVIQVDVLKAVQRTLENSIKYDKTLKETITALEEDTDLLKMLPKYDAALRPVNVPARLETIVRTNTADAINQGRQALFGDPELKGFVIAYAYSSILDDRTSEVCEYLDGKIQKSWEEKLPPNHFNCRSTIVAVTVIDEWDGKEDNISSPKGIPQKGFA